MLAEAYRLKEAVLALFRESQTKEAARYRRDMLVERFKNIPELKQVIGLLSGERFEQMIVYLITRTWTRPTTTLSALIAAIARVGRIATKRAQTAPDSTTCAWRLADAMPATLPEMRN